MILFTILAIIAIIIAVIALALLVAGGTAFIVIFGDLIVCVFLIILLMKWLFGRKK